jgi:hypothetical protein
MKDINAAIAKYFLRWDTTSYPSFSNDPTWSLEILNYLGPGYQVGLNPDPQAPPTKKYRCFKEGSQIQTYAATIGLAVCYEALRTVGF